MAQTLEEGVCDHCDQKDICVTFDLLALGVVQLCVNCLARALKIVEKER
jgi:hypothetical protein